FFATNIFQMALEKRQLRFLWIRVVEQGPVVFTTIIRRSGLLRPADLKKQVVFLLLKLVVAGLQSLRAICSGLLFGQDRLVLCVRVRLLTSAFLLLLLIRCVVCGLLGRIRRCFFLIVMKAFLHFFW